MVVDVLLEETIVDIIVNVLLEDKLSEIREVAGEVLDAGAVGVPFQFPRSVNFSTVGSS